MITINTRDAKFLPTNLHIAARKIENKFETLAKDIDLLPIVRFDPIYTKPVDLTSVDIVGEALTKDITITIKTYTQNWFSYKYAPVISHVKDSEPTTIYYNTRIFDWGMTISDWERNILHELVHVFDHHSPHTFWHGDNSLKGKDNTAPVKLSMVLSQVGV